MLYIFNVPFGTVLRNSLNLQFCPKPLKSRTYHCGDHVKGKKVETRGHPYLIKRHEVSSIHLITSYLHVNSGFDLMSEHHACELKGLRGLANVWGFVLRFMTRHTLKLSNAIFRWCELVYQRFSDTSGHSPTATYIKLQRLLVLLNFESRLMITLISVLTYGLFWRHRAGPCLDYSSLPLVMIWWKFNRHFWNWGEREDRSLCWSCVNYKPT